MRNPRGDQEKALLLAEVRIGEHVQAAPDARQPPHRDQPGKGGARQAAACQVACAGNSKAADPVEDDGRGGSHGYKSSAMIG